MDNHQALQRLQQMAEPGYQAFSSKLLPGVAGILGVRLPKIRALAKEIAREQDWAEFLAQAPEGCLELTLLHGFIIAQAKMPPEQRLERVVKFIPLIDNWSVCDSFCTSLKDARRFPQPYWELAGQQLESGEEYAMRFGAVLMLHHFILPEYVDGVLARLDGAQHPGYYFKMAVAWAVAECCAKFPQAALDYLTSPSCHLDPFTYQKAIQKALESYRVTPEDKARLRALKTKER